MTKYNYEEFEKAVFGPRFGMLTKTELELLLFKVFYNDSDNRASSPYELGLKLGMTESRVRNLKLKLDLLEQTERKQPSDVLLSSAVSFDGDRRVIVQTNDTYQLEALWHYLVDECGIVVSKFGSGSQLSLPIDKYFEILGALMEKDPKLESKINELASSEKEVAKQIGALNKKTLGEVFRDPESRKEFAMQFFSNAAGSIAGDLIRMLCGGFSI